MTFVECTTCKKTLEEKEFSPEIVTKLQREKEKRGKLMYPFWMFSGTALVLALLGFGIYQSNVDDENEKQYIQKPKKGDLYRFRLTDGFYSSAKVTNVDKDSVYLTFSNYETDQVTGIDDISKPENFTAVGQYSYKKERLKELFKSDTIYQIDRD